MDIWNSFLKNIGDPLIIAGTIIGMGWFLFKERKVKLAVSIFFGGILVYYVAHNAETTLALFGPLVKKVLEWISKAFGV